MADEAERKRCAAAEELDGAVRQALRYVDNHKPSTRQLNLKMKIVSEAQERLKREHYAYCNLAEIAANSADARDYIREKLDAAEDCIDTCVAYIEEKELKSAEEVKNALDEAKHRKSKEESVKKHVSSKAQIAAEERFTDELCKKILELEKTRNFSSENFVLVKTYLARLEQSRDKLELAWNSTMMAYGEDDEINTDKMTKTRLYVQEVVSSASAFMDTCSSEHSKDVSLGRIAEEDQPLNSTLVTNAEKGSNLNLRMEKLGYPKFSGNIRTYARFQKDFEKMVKPAYPDQQQLAYVIKKNCLDGTAKTLTENLDDIKEIWDRLDERYGDQLDLVDLVIKDLDGVQSMEEEEDQKFIDFVDLLEKGLQDLDAIGARSEIANGYTVKLIEEKLSRLHYNSWLKEEKNIEGSSRFEKILLFLKDERKRSEKLVQRSSQQSQSTKLDTKDLTSTKKSSRKEQALGVQDGSKKVKKDCILHANGSHFTRQCRAFKGKTLQERAQIIQAKNGCKLCLSSTHAGQPCPWTNKWNPCNVNNCGEYHSHLLHGAANIGLLTGHSRAEAISNNTLLLVQEIPTAKGKVSAFFDSGSTISLVSKSFVKRCNLKGVQVTFDLITVGNESKTQHTYMHNIALRDASGATHFVQAFEIKDICGRLRNVNVSHVARLFKGLKVSDVKRKSGAVELLIGMNHVNIHPHPLKEAQGMVLFKSRFGTKRILGGSHHSLKSNDELNFAAKRVAGCRIKNARVLFDKHQEPGVDFFSAEDFGVKLPPNCERCRNCKDCTVKMHQLSKEEQRELAIIDSNLVLDPVENRWSTVYPYKCDPSVLEDNRAQAEAILMRLEKRLLQSPSSAEKFKEQFEDLITRGILKEITHEESENYEGPFFHVTQHEVFKEESSSSPLRLVIHSSLKYKGLSLNDILMKGPNTLNNIFAVQLRFRSYPVALVCDIAKMYHSIKTTPTERHLRRVLWRNLDTEAEIKTYGTETVTFGDRPAGAIATVALKKTAQAFEEINPVASRKIINDSYVDDIVTGEENHHNTEKLKNGIQEILSKGGFRVKGFVKSGDTSEETLSLLGTGELGRVLGIGWDPGRDVFRIKVRINFSKKYRSARTAKDLVYEEIPSLLKMKISRSMLLSVTNSCYDPLGLLSPITITMKIGLRKLYNKELSLGWDDDLPEAVKAEWVRILQQVKQAEKITFKRCIKPDNVSNDPDLIISNDGSDVAMCVTAHIRWEGEGGVHCQLWTAKSRVTPLRRQSTPRSEMQSAVMASRLVKSIKENSIWKFRKIYHVSDSECTLATLRKDTTVLREYMGNRVAEILDNTEIDQWYHVNTRDNISDLGTRSNATVKDINETNAWQNGLPWMYLPVEKWPVSQRIKENVPEEELILNKICAHLIVEETPISYEKYIGKSYQFVVNLTAILLRICKRKSFKGGAYYKPEELVNAEDFIVKNSMKMTRKLLDDGRLESLRPKEDDQGIIKLDCRALKGMKIFYENEEYPILDNHDPIAQLWMKKVHKEDHSGITKTVSKSRRKYWIVRARKLATKVKRACYRCRILDKLLANQLMSPLPLSRQTMSPIYSQISLDLFGPFDIVDTVKRRIKKKIWGLIITCLATRAVHLDVTEDYGADAVLDTIRKFVALRGCPNSIFSDKGSQLIVAADQLKTWATSKSINWDLAPAEGQHQNGVSEAFVRSIKRSITHVIGETVLTFSGIQTAFYEIASIINARPIGIISGSDPSQPTAITPNHLLLGRSTPDVVIGEFDHSRSPNKRMRHIQNIVEQWWKKWYDVVLPSLVPSYKWRQKHRNVQVGDVCLIKYRNEIKGNYRLGRVTSVKMGQDGLVRTVKLTYKNPTESTFREVDRPIHGIAVIVPMEEQSSLNPQAQDFQPHKKSN